MKKIILLCTISVALASCSSYKSLINKMYTSDDNVAVNPDDNLNNPDQDGLRPSDERPTVTLKLDHKSKTHEIEATIVTEWNGSPQGSIYLTWTVPKGSQCYSTSFPITKINEENDSTVDSQSVTSKGKVCAGTWVASVTDKYDNKVLAKEKVVIK